ncbi:uncharacterized protein BJX67DRAFT_383760 [Aspergillus lucknowensis]|uniref:Uncharacterized protein n=1 Tax=Aspergillus lucknowensis TaxID=176173 RepID=A0ABR4LM59_9EURO
MVSLNPVYLFKSKDSSESTNNQEPVFDPNTVTMVQPGRPNAPTTEHVVTEQPAQPEQMRMQLRGGGGAGFCCGL